MRFSAILLILFIASNAFSQTNHQISGTVLDPNNKPIDLALISLYDSKDSTLIKNDFTDSDGTFQLSSIERGAYILIVKTNGFLDFQSEINLNESIEIETITLKNDENFLEEVVVNGSVPFVERKIDRLVITPDAQISSAGSNALEVLELAPGVMIDQNGQIIYKGRAGVAVYINDKPSYLSGSELENYLRSLPAGSIKNIELIENPPARYDASGNAGIININIKQNAFKGFYGNASVSYRRSKYNGTNNSLNLNYSKKKISISTNLNGGLWENFQDLNINRYYLNENGDVQSAFNQNSFNNRKGHYISGRIALDIYASDRSTFGLSYKKSESPSEAKTDNTSFVSTAEGTLIQKVVADNLSERKFGNDLVSIYFRQILDSLGSEISFDVDFVQYRSSNDQHFLNYQYSPSDSLTYNDQINGEIPSKITIYAAKTDYSKPFKNSSVFSAGLKSAFTQTDNEAIYTNTLNGITSPDYSLSNRFLYDEWINAAYVNYNLAVGKVKLQFGLRGEATNLKGNQLGNLQINDTSFTRTYASLFPTLYIARPLDSTGNHNLNFSYSRRIQRPYFQDLNPFISPLDKFTYYTGNPNLLPTFSHNLSFSYSYKNFLITDISYSLIVDGINETLEIQDEIYYSRPGNISSSQFLTTSLNLNAPLAKWFSINFYAQASYVKFESQLYNEQLNSSGINVYTSITNSLSFGNGWKINLGGRYLNDQVYSQLLIKGYAVMTAGLQKTFLKGKGSIRLNMNDIFYSRIGNGVINNLTQTNADWNSKFDSRSVSIEFSIRFGKSNSKNRKHQGSGSESEQNRVKS